MKPARLCGGGGGGWNGTAMWESGGAAGAPRRAGNSTAAAAAAEAAAPRGDECGAVSVLIPLSMMVTGLAGNALAMLLVSRAYRAKANRRKRSFLLCIGSLALTDLAGQLLTSPVVIAVYVAGRQWQRVDPSGALCAFFGLSMTAFGLCPLFIASAMAAERALATRAPHWYSSHMRPGVTKAALLGIWLAGLAFALLPLAGVGRYAPQWPGTWCFIEVPGGAAFAAAFAFLGLASLLVTAACNVATIAALVSRCRAKVTASRAGKQWGRIATETLIQLLGIMCVLLACWSPLLIMMLKMIFNHTSIEHCNATSYVDQNLELQEECNFFLTAVRLASLNQILDPWVYLLLRKILLQKFCQAASAVSGCSNTRWKERQVTFSDDIRQTTA